jgi:hypothetical protein
MRGWVGRLQLLLALAIAVVLRSESRETHDHILLSQIRDFPSLEGQVPVFIFPRNRVAQLYPQLLGMGNCLSQIKVTLRQAVYQAPWDSQPEISFQVNTCGNVTCSLARRWVFLLRICLVFRQMYVSHICHVNENSSFCTTQVLCQYRLYRANRAYLTYLMLQRHICHLNGRKLDHHQV